MRPIYLDHAATTPVREEVREVMARCLEDAPGNPSSLHAPGRRARAALETARERVASALHARRDEIVFTRGGTESDNLAVLGFCRRRGRTLARPVRVACSAIEHSAVAEAVAWVEREGGATRILPVGPDGSVDEETLAHVLSAPFDLISLMWVNNETGTRLPIPEVSTRARAAGVLFHTDAVQAVGKVPVRVDEAPVDLLTLTGHKIHGPRGVGVLYVRRGVELDPLFAGGGQERGLRPGTEDVAGAVGLAEAVERAVSEQSEEARRLRPLTEALWTALRDGVPGAVRHGADGATAPHILNVGIPGVDPSMLIAALDLEGVAASSGSACASGSSRPSRVLAAMYDAPQPSLRLSLGRGSDLDGAREAGRRIIGAVTRIRSAARASSDAGAPALEA